MGFLAETDETYALAKADLLRQEIVAKRIRARIFAGSEGPVEGRKAAAEGHREVIDADEALIMATVRFETLKAQRSRAEILIDVWRSVESSRRKS